MSMAFKLKNGDCLSGNLDSVEYSRSMYVPHDPNEYGLDFPVPSLTRQEFKTDCDVNVLMKKYRDHGIVPTMRVGDPVYMDCSEVPDFSTAMQVFIEAEKAFMSLPADVRKQMDNDPAKFVEFSQNPENLEQMRKWGLAPPAKEPDAPMRVEVVNPEPKGEAPAAS